MPLSSLTCPICLAELRPKTPVPEGTRVRCPKCKGSFVAGGAPPAEQPEPVQEPMPDAADRPAEEEIAEAVEGVEERPPPPRRTRRRRNDDEERPRKRRAKKGGVPLWVWLTAGGVGLLLFCGCFGTVGVLVGAGAFGGSGWTSIAGGTRITWDNYNRLHRNMTEAQVRAILGPPTRQVKPGELNPVAGEYGPKAKTLVWEDPISLDFIGVVFEDGKAVDRRCLVIEGGAGLSGQGFTDP